MSQSTDAILFFGVALPEDFAAPWGDDFDEWMAKELGVSEPPMEFNESTKHHFHDYWGAKTAILRTASVDLVRHCSGDYPMYALAVRGTITSASRGDVESIELGRLHESKSDALIKFLADYKIPYDWKDLGWKLVSYWH